MGATPHKLAKEASLPNLWGLSPATTKSVAALSVPMPGKDSSSGAACATSRSRCLQLGDLLGGPRNGGPPNAARTWWPWARRGASPRRKRAATETSSFVESPRKRWRSSSGAVAQALELVGGLRPRLDRGAAGRARGPDHLHTALAISWARPRLLRPKPLARPARRLRGRTSRGYDVSFAAGASGAPPPVPRFPWLSGAE